MCLQRVGICRSRLAVALDQGHAGLQHASYRMTKKRASEMVCWRRQVLAFQNDELFFYWLRPSGLVIYLHLQLQLACAKLELGAHHLLILICAMILQ